MMTIVELRERFPHYWREGRGSYVIVCPSAERLTFFQTLEGAREVKNESCGPRCNRYDQPHFGIRLTADTPGPGRKTLSSSFRKMVADA